jgi:hypothetical protein
MVGGAGVGGNMRRKMSNPVKHHWMYHREMIKIAKEICVQVENRFWDFGPLLGLRTLTLNFASHHPISKLKNVPQIEYGFESKWMCFVWCSDNSFDDIGMPFRRDLKSGIKIFTHNIYTQGKF